MKKSFFTTFLVFVLISAGQDDGMVLGDSSSSSPPPPTAFCGFEKELPYVLKPCTEDSCTNACKKLHGISAYGLCVTVSGDDQCFCRGLMPCPPPPQTP